MFLQSLLTTQILDCSEVGRGALTLSILRLLSKSVVKSKQSEISYRKHFLLTPSNEEKWFFEALFVAIGERKLAVCCFDFTFRKHPKAKEFPES